MNLLLKALLSQQLVKFLKVEKQTVVADFYSDMSPQLFSLTVTLTGRWRRDAK